MAEKKQQSLLVCLCTTIAGIILLPFQILSFVLFFVVFLVFTITGVGPILQYCYQQRDKKLLDVDKLISNGHGLQSLTVPGDINNASAGKPYRVVVRLTKPYEGIRGYVCIPNGLGATIVTLGQIQEKLTNAGFVVLTFDRFGVGFSDENTTGIAPTAADLVKECDFVMSQYAPEGIQWIFIGPSMGSIVSQCYIAHYPNKVVGFLNMDGLPYPFKVTKKAFLSAGGIYKFYASIIWTGVFRPFIATSFKAMAPMFACKAFPFEIALAQLNQARFFRNIAYEMSTMMDCCEVADKAWGDFSVLLLDAKYRDLLVRARPNESVHMDMNQDGSKVRRIVEDRSVSESGDNWAQIEEVSTFIDNWNKNPTAYAAQSTDPSSSSPMEVNISQPLAESGLADSDRSGKLRSIWSRLVVRVMSARNHNFGSAMADSFYTQEMKDLAAAEHSQHAIFSRSGFRTVYPNLSHSVIFGESDEIVRHTAVIAEETATSNRV